MFRILSLLFVFSLFLNNEAVSQYAMNLTPQISSDNSISERIAYTRINIQYGSPKVRGRKIWGEMEEYGQIWRAGANKATTIEFSEDVKIEGEPLPKGIYSLFVIPEKTKKWTIIFNQVADQWGAFNYDEDEDALRVEVEAQMNSHTEDLTYDIVANDFDGAYVTLEWEKIRLSFYVEVEHLMILESMVTEQIALAPENTKWVIYLQAANYLIDQEERLDLASEWLKLSSEHYSENGEWSGQYYPKTYILGDLLWAKAKLAAYHRDFTKALEYAEQMKAIEGEYVFYEREKESEEIDLRMATWSKMD